MRWTQPRSVGDRKRICKFLWWPMTIGFETRWLERVVIEYRYQVKHGYVYDYTAWVPMLFIDERVL